MDRIKKLLKQLLVLLMVIMVVMFVAGRVVDWVGCEWYGYQTTREVRYAPFLGCLVKVNESWYPRSELRVEQ